jgi:hypothetical protein
MFTQAGKRVLRVSAWIFNVHFGNSLILWILVQTNALAKYCRLNRLVFEGAVCALVGVSPYQSEVCIVKRYLISQWSKVIFRKRDHLTIWCGENIDHK